MTKELASNNYGATGLGLLLSLAGAVGVTLSATVSLIAFAAPHAIPAPLFFVALSGWIRSTFHSLAGAAVLYGTPAVRVRSLWTYIGIAGLQSATVLIVLHQGNVTSGTRLLHVAALLLAWPATLAVLFRPGRALAERLQRPARRDDDLGCAELAATMRVLSTIALLLASLMLLVVVLRPEKLLAGELGVLAVVSGCALCSRALCHRRIAAALRVAGDLEIAAARAIRYVRYGLVSAVFIGAIVGVTAVAGGAAGTALVLAGGVTAMLMTWPLIVRRFILERSFAVYVASEAPPCWRPGARDGAAAIAWWSTALGALCLADGLGLVAHQPMEALLVLSGALLAASGISTLRCSARAGAMTRLAANASLLSALLLLSTMRPGLGPTLSVLELLHAGVLVAVVATALTLLALARGQSRFPAARLYRQP